MIVFGYKIKASVIMLAKEELLSMKTFTIQDARAILVELGVPDKVVFGSPQPIALKAADRLLQSMSKSMVISCPNRKNWIIN